jgi:hypothetical protein
LKTNLVAVAKDDFLGLVLWIIVSSFYCCLSLYCLRRKEASDGDSRNRIRRTTSWQRNIYKPKKEINNKEPFYVALEKRCITFESEIKYRNLRNE